MKSETVQPRARAAAFTRARSASCQFMAMIGLAFSPAAFALRGGGVPFFFGVSVGSKRASRPSPFAFCSLTSLYMGSRGAFSRHGQRRTTDDPRADGERFAASNSQQARNSAMASAPPPQLGSVVAATIITAAEKAAGVTAAEVAARHAQEMQQQSTQTMGGRGIQVRMMRSPTPTQQVSSTGAAVASALEVKIFEPVAAPVEVAPIAFPSMSAEVAQPTGALQSGVPPVGAEGVGVARRLAEPPELNMFGFLQPQLAKTSEQTQEIVNVEAVAHHRAFQSAGGGPKVVMRGAVTRVHASGSQRVESGGVVVLQLRGPIELVVAIDDVGAGGNDQDQDEDQTEHEPIGEETEPPLEPAEDTIKKLDEEAKEQERREGDHGDNLADEPGSVSVGDQGTGERNP